MDFEVTQIPGDFLEKFGSQAGQARRSALFSVHIPILAAKVGKTARNTCAAWIGPGGGHHNGWNILILGNLAR